jgi:hypothetical protein
MTFNSPGPIRYRGQKEDLTWGRFDYKVTRTQKAALDGLLYMIAGLTPDQNHRPLPSGTFYSQRPNDGAVLIGIDHRSVTVYRSGRITSNSEISAAQQLAAT